MFISSADTAILLATSLPKAPAPKTKNAAKTLLKILILIPPKTL
ncbi:MAG: hypothetical protein ACRC0Y_01345 [Fusobacteriaceae bacterium]